MISRTRSGKSCRTIQNITARDNHLPPYTHGIIQYEMKNSGYHLVFVRWENGIRIPVFIDEIEICDSAISTAA